MNSLESTPRIFNVTLRHATEEESRQIQPDKASTFSKIKNTANLIVSPNLHSLLVSAAEAKPVLAPFESYVLPTWHITKNPCVMKEIFKHPRQDQREEGLFMGSDTLIKIFNEIFPEYQLTSDDSFMTCGVDQSLKFRDFIGRHLSSATLTTQEEDITQIAQNELSKWETQKGHINLRRLNVYACAVISKTMLGYEGPYGSLTKSIDQLNGGIIQRFMGKQPNRAEFESAKKSFRETLENIWSAETHSEPIKELIENNDFTEQQKNLLILMLFFAGEETTSSLLTYIVWQLALKPDIQEMVYKKILGCSDQKKPYNIQIIKKIISVALKEHAPAYTVGRVAKQDLVLDFENEEGVKESRLIKKGQRINACPALAGQDISKKGTFDIEECGSTSETHFPFGHGPHKCLGESLAKLEIRIFLYELISKFQFVTPAQNNEVDQIGLYTLKLSKDITIFVAPRDNNLVVL